MNSEDSEFILTAIIGGLVALAVISAIATHSAQIVAWLTDVYAVALDAIVRD